MKEKDLLEIYKERIANEAKHGDKAKACKNAGGYTPRIYLNALEKEKISDLTDGELRVITALIKILNERKAEVLELKHHEN